MNSRSLIRAVLAIQSVCLLFFVYDLVFPLLNLRSRPIPWHIHEVIEIGALLGLVLGAGLGILALRQSQARLQRAEDRLRAASGAFMEVVQEHFDRWGLTPAERDVAAFSIKGLSLAEIAALRETSEGTVKAQTNAIYRKAGVTGRVQLLSLFVEELLDETGLEAAGSRVGAGQPSDVSA